MGAVNNQVWFITGATRGLGAVIATAALRAGHIVVATGRDAGRIRIDDREARGKLCTLSLDITNGAQITAAVDEAMSTFGRIDVLVNNAGYAHLGAFEDITDAEMRAQFETNVFGTMSVTRAVLPIMRKQRSGRIFNIASMAGYIGGSHYPVYAASKFAVEGFSESLSAEVAKFGIHVTLLEPGFFRTDFLKTSVRHGNGNIDDYRAETISNRAELDAHHLDDACDPTRLAEILLTLSAVPEPPVRCPIGADAIAGIEGANARVQDEIERWRGLLSLPADISIDRISADVSR